MVKSAALLLSLTLVQVRVWDIAERHQTMRAALKEHKGTSYSAQSHTGLSLHCNTGVITCIKIRRDDEEVIHTHTLSSSV